jgi:flagellar biosynthesis GTPase FlhF
MMGTMALTPFRQVAALLLCFVWGLSHAQDSEPYEPDPPERAARLSYIEGEVSLQPAGEEQWAPAILNRPLTTGDKLWAEPDARAEIQVGPAAVRLGGNTGFSFLNVDDNTIQMRVTSGIVNVSVRTLRDSEQIEIDTPNVALSVLRPGNYRVEVNDAGETTVVKVSEGELQATGPSQDIVVHAQQVVTFTGIDNLVARHGRLGAPDEFDTWNLERDRRDERAASSRTAEYVSPDVTGYEDLEDNGTWSSEPDYGYVWTPRVAVGWAPYSFGRWVWVSPWGWTWIDDTRWGYAPFHYGRWAHVRNRWCWVPGPRHVRAVYAPALVGWGGSYGSRVSWFPLGPREIYVPGRRHSRHYWERVNFANTHVNRTHFDQAVANRLRDAAYRNRAVPGGVTTVSRDTFTSAGRTADHRVRFREQDLARSPAMAAAPRIAPVLASRLGGSTRANVRVPPPSIANRQVVVRRDPPPAAERFTRRPAASGDFSQSLAERVARTPDRNRGSEPAVRSGQDRPPRVDRPNNEPAAPAHSSVFDRRAIADAVREDRDRQVRGERQRREVERQREAFQQREALQQREASQQREAADRQRWQRQDEQARQQREQVRAARESQRQESGRQQRQVDALRQAAERQSEQRQRSEQRQQSEQRQRSEQRQQPEQRQQSERPNRSESRPAESRSSPRNHQDGNSRSKRD